MGIGMGMDILPRIFFYKKIPEKIFTKIRCNGVTKNLILMISPRFPIGPPVKKTLSISKKTLTLSQKIESLVSHFIFLVA